MSGDAPVYCEATYEQPPYNEDELNILRIFQKEPYHSSRVCIRQHGHSGSHISQVGRVAGADNDVIVTVWDEDQLITVSGDDVQLCWQPLAHD